MVARRWQPAPPYLRPLVAINRNVNTDPTMNAAMVVLNLRLSRLALAAVAGAMLSIAGTIMRATTHNGLTNPVMLGVRESASLVVLGCGHRHAVLGKSALEIGCETDTSDATVIRAIQALGFQGLVDIKETLEAYLGVTDSPVEKMATKTNPYRVIRTQQSTSLSKTIKTCLKCLPTRKTLRPWRPPCAFFRKPASSACSASGPPASSPPMRQGYSSSPVSAPMRSTPPGSHWPNSFWSWKRPYPYHASARPRPPRSPDRHHRGRSPRHSHHHAARAGRQRTQKHATTCLSAPRQGVALHAPSLVATETIALALSAALPERSLETQERLV